LDEPEPVEVLYNISSACWSNSRYPWAVFTAELVEDGALPLAFDALGNASEGQCPAEDLDDIATIRIWVDWSRTIEVEEGFV
jgi:hypothetical protein